MIPKSTKNDMETPLLEKKGSLTPLNVEFTTTFRSSKHDLETPDKPKYFHFGFLNRLIFHWANQIIKVNTMQREY